MSKSSLRKSLPLRVFEILAKNGVTSPEQIIFLSESDILKFGNISVEDVTQMKDVSASCIANSSPKTVFDILQEKSPCDRVSFGCKTIDNVLRGGLRRGTITELSAESGCGKTQICLQVAAHAWRTGAVYICTEDAFPSSRLHQIFSALHESLPEKDRLANNQMYGENIFVQQVMEVTDLKRCIKVNLKRLLEARKISVVIVDSIAAPFRGNYQGVHSGILRAQDLKEIAMLLLDSAIKHNLAVLCINQVTSTVSSGDSIPEAIPSLGLAWANVISTRLMIRKINKFVTRQVERKENHKIEISHFEYGTDQIVDNETCKNDSIQLRQLEVSFAPDIVSGPIAQFVITSEGVVGIKTE